MMTTLRELHASNHQLDKKLDWNTFESGMFGLSELTALLNREDLREQYELELSSLFQRLANIDDPASAFNFVRWATDLYVDFGKKNNETIPAQVWGEWGMKHLQQRALALQNATVEADERILEQGLQITEAQELCKLLLMLDQCFTLIQNHLAIYDDHTGSVELLSIADEVDFFLTVDQSQEALTIRQEYEQSHREDDPKQIQFLGAMIRIITQLKNKRSTTWTLFALRTIVPVLIHLQGDVFARIPTKELVAILTKHGMKPLASQFLADIEVRRRATLLDARDILRSPSPNQLGREIFTTGLRLEDYKRLDLLREKYGKGLSDLEGSD